MHCGWPFLLLWSLDTSYWAYFFPFPNSLSTWQVRLRWLTAADTDRRSHSPLPPGTMSSMLLAKDVSFEHSVSSPRPVITSRREQNINKANVFQHPIDSHNQFASSSLISPHFAAGAVEVGRGAASFLATESIGTVLIPRLMTRIAGHGDYMCRVWHNCCFDQVQGCFLSHWHFTSTC